MDIAEDHPIAQDASDTIQNGSVAQALKDEKAIAAAEFHDLADSKVVPEQPAATGQPLTPYHSMIYRLLSWKNPRATSIAFASTVTLIFAARYVRVESYLLKSLYTVLGLSAAAEIAGKSAFGNGFMSQVRPRKYWTIPKDSLERFMDDAEQLINFFVIEFQRIMFAENVYATVGAFFSAFISYFLIKWLPLWGLSLLSTCLIFLAPLIYVKNKEFIDAQLNTANEIMMKQRLQLRDVAHQYTGKATEQIRVYGGQATHQFHGLVDQAKQKAGYGMPDAPRTEPMPSAPTEEPIEAPAPVAA